MPRCVILYHETPDDATADSHLDFMLEANDELLTWRWGEIPQDNQVFVVSRLANHRVEYLTLEGTLSGNRGTVTRIDHGTFEPPIENTPQQFSILIQTTKLQGELVAHMLADEQWEFRFLPKNP
ncbi:MAG: hypothetical protein HN617_13550 [Planctomycetaceae bacterium]|jgi:hypothetical protein|nr:hypothetical protein [Planctomycetaceae bacterium]MBT4012924.1 hypothetical protein [Planctomycetaceae bacterium]MBT4726194.1 hypothetical protein [Planctomycetaceae bacterium]MBT4846532.1 hypothetical protein [Planctomycetaceae bacterium]MBT5123094.1 hypothetical protein [Planctomycetaceae bacterium]